MERIINRLLKPGSVPKGWEQSEGEQKGLFASRPAMLLLGAALAITQEPPPEPASLFNSALTLAINRLASRISGAVWPRPLHAMLKGTPVY
jgi:hypothetical protein